MAIHHPPGKPVAHQPYHHGNLKEALLQQAGEILAETGLEALSLRELARRVGVTQAAIYRHFPDKQGLLAEVAIRGFQELGRRMDATRTGNDLAGAIRAMGEIYVGFALEHGALFKLMFGAELKQEEGSPLAEAGDATFAILQGVLEQGIAAGIIVDRDPEMLAVAAWASVHGLATIALDRICDHRTSEQWDVWVAGALEVFRRGIARNPDEPPGG